jgi:hypothetical protein
MVRMPGKHPSPAVRPATSSTSSPGNETGGSELAKREAGNLETANESAAAAAHLAAIHHPGGAGVARQLREPDIILFALSSARSAAYFSTVLRLRSLRLIHEVFAIGNAEGSGKTPFAQLNFRPRGRDNRELLVRCLSACNPRRGTTSTLPFCCESELTLLCAAARACSVPSPFSSFCRENFGLAVDRPCHTHRPWVRFARSPAPLPRSLAYFPFFRRAAPVHTLASHSQSSREADSVVQARRMRRRFTAS